MIRAASDPTTHLGAGALALLALTSAAGCDRPPIATTCLALEGPVGPTGFDAPVSIRASLRCDLGRGQISWRQSGRASLREPTVSRDGRTFSGRTPAAAVLRSPASGAIPWGIVPFSPRTRGEIRLVATWRGEDGRSIDRELELVAADRSRGLPNTPVGARVHLGGDGWRLETRPPGSRAEIGRRGGLAALTPDVPGDWRLLDGAGRSLALRSGRYVDTPLDCGRSGCHEAITEVAATSPMTTVLARGLATAEREHGSGYPGCALACHAIGDPGLDDGGFVQVARTLGITHLAQATSWETLPRPLRRLGGVGCLACHGPGALPEVGARWAVLRADVCATCHDASPRYGHVAAWLGSAMSRADADPRAASDRECTGCHTTWGFLETVAPAGSPGRRRPPPEVGPTGIACAACHAVHEHEHLPRPGPALLRSPPRPPVLATAAPTAGPAVCLPCHAPGPRTARPFASAAAIWLGRGGIDPGTGEPLDGPSPHASIAGGCLGCHREAPAADLDRGRSHGFVAPREGCRPCHGEVPLDADFGTAARRLWAGLFGDAVLPEPGDSPGHADTPPVDRGTPRGRAAWNLLLLMEDRGAGAHNPAYARRLLAAAEDLRPAIRREDRP